MVVKNCSMRVTVAIDLATAVAVLDFVLFGISILVSRGGLDHLISIK